MIFVCVCVNFLMGKEGRKIRSGHLSWEGYGVPRAEEQILRSPVSQRVEVSTGSVVYTEGE